MYRSVLISIGIAAIACKGSATNSASAANTTASTTQTSSTSTSDTLTGVAGPTSTTDGVPAGSALSGAPSAPAAGAGTSAPNGVSAATASSPSAPGAPNPNRVPNEMGRIMVLEYHLITDHNSAYARERGQFRKDLELLYDRGYRPVNMSDVLDKKLDLPKGLSPVVMVFDDASPEQFSYIENNGKLEIDPKSGMGIWLDFRKTHPDWSNKAVYCLLSGANAGHNFFGDRGVQGQKSQWRFQKVKWLADNGFELCDHTLWHAQLSKYPDAFVQEQIARNAMAIDSAVPGYKIRSMALPQGLWPKNRALASKGSWTNPKTGKTVTYDWPVVFEVAGGPMRSPYDPAFNPGSTPRIQVIGNAIEQMISKLETAGNAYISDGNPAVVARPVAGGTQAAVKP
ncbi:MAG TPA: polysaccharide deacetylase family protein [Gemmatimonadaceae bacterium]|nr:polysaccharide deacetylase family protein [Gemmatimonadaceae bacterium]